MCKCATKPTVGTLPYDESMYICIFMYIHLYQFISMYICLRLRLVPGIEIFELHISSQLAQSFTDSCSRCGYYLIFPQPALVLTNLNYPGTKTGPRTGDPGTPRVRLQISSQLAPDAPPTLPLVQSREQ